MELDRRTDETEGAYHRRLVYGKLVDKTLIDSDYSEIAERLYGRPYSSDVARRMMYGSCKTLQLMDSEASPCPCVNASADNASADDTSALSEFDRQKIELQVERQKVRDQRTALNKIIRDRSRREDLDEILVRAVQEGNLPRLDYEYRPRQPSDNDLLVSLNDIHYGACVTNYWNTYNSDICREMMRRYLDNIIQIARTHNSENCVIWSNGDAISGNIHKSIAVTNKENVIEQVKGVSELIAEFIAELSKRFARVTFVSVAGNHSRLDPNKDNALVSERMDDLIEWYLAARLQNFENVTIGGGEKVDGTMYLIDVRGQTYCGVHGDFDGTPGKIQALQTMARKPLYAVLSGHLHHCKMDDVQGIRTIMAGSFLGMDDYCVQKRIYGRPEQMVCVCDESGVRCAYHVELR